MPVVEVKDSQGIAAGDVVHVARHELGQQLKVDLLTAQVIAIDEDGQHSVMTLQSLNGQSIEPGDSGGGIWSDGVLLGNMWMTIREEWTYPDQPEGSQMVVTDRSRAAGLTESLLNLVGQSLQIVEDHTTVAEGLAWE